MDLVALAREQLLDYPTASYVHAEVVDARPDGERFVLGLDDGRELAALRVVLATGVAAGPGRAARGGRRAALTSPNGVEGWRGGGRSETIAATTTEGPHGSG